MKQKIENKNSFTLSNLPIMAKSKLKSNAFNLAIIISFILSSNVASGKLERRHFQQYDTASWNMQGAFSGSHSKWADVIGPAMQMTNPRHTRSIDVFALQESGSLPSSHPLLPEAPVRHINGGQINPLPVVTQNQWTIDSTSRATITTAFIYHIQSNAQHNVAIVSTQQADEVIVVNPMNPAHRPAVGIRIGLDYFFSLHAQPYDNNEAPGIVQRIENDLSIVLNQFPDTTWIIMGDYNRSPASLANNLGNAPDNVHREIVHTDSITQRSGGNLDYAVTGTGLRNRRATMAYIHAENGMFSDHTAVLFLPFLIQATRN